MTQDEHKKLKEAAKSVGNAADKLEEVADVIEYLNRETAREALAKCVEALRSARCGVIDVPTEEDMRDYVREIDEAIKQAKQALGEGESKFDDPQFATSLEELEELIWSRAEILRLNVSLNRLRDQIADPETVTITRKRYEQYQGMTRREQLIALAEKVRALPGPDRDVDAEIAALCRLYFGNQDFVRDWSGEWRSINGLIHLLGKHGSCGNFSPEKFTGSIDAAQSISDAPCFFASDFGCDGIPTVMLCTTTETPPKHVKSEGRNLILAWCSAALMARAEEEG